ncbi:MAG: hypothetical protein EBZ59_03675 [Planctomycetia bacterium]|nr:hypothetical protein [Planctomycetia bacterium]
MASGARSGLRRGTGEPSPHVAAGTDPERYGPMKQVNRRLLIAIVLLSAAAVGSVYALHRFQLYRNAGGLAKLARLRLAEGRKTEALELFSRYVFFRPNDGEAHAELARLVLEETPLTEINRRDITRVYNVLESAVRKNPDDDELRERLAEFLLWMGRHGDAKNHLQLLLGKASLSDPPAAESDTSAGDESAEDAEKPKLDPVAIRVMLARALAGSGDFDEAVNVAAELVGFNVSTREFDPDRKPFPGASEAYLILATIMDEKLKDPEATTTALEQLVRNNPDEPQGWLAMARWTRHRGDLKAAARSAAKAMELSPDDPVPLMIACEVALASQDFERAAELSRKGLEQFSSDDRMYRTGAAVALQLQKPDEAIALLQRGLEKLPDSPPLLMMLADAVLQKGDIPQVESIVSTLRSRVGDSNPMVNLLEARVLMAKQHWLQAKQKLESLRPLVAESAEATRQIDLFLGQCFEQLGQFDEQLEANRRVLNDDVTSLAARVGAAAALAASGKTEEALEEFELVASSFPPERLATFPQVWSPLLQLRVAAQMKRPESDRDWSQVDGLIDQLQESKDISDTQLALLRADVLVRKEETDSAIALLAKAVQASPADAQLQSASALLSLRVRGANAGRAILDAVPQALRDEPAILLVDAQIAARESGDAAAERLAEIERRVGELPPERSSRVLSGLASIHLGMGRRKDGERLLGRLLEMTPDDLRARLTLFELAREEGNVDKARVAADWIAKVSGSASPQARLAEASVHILSVRDSQKAKVRKTQTRLKLAPEERASLEEARNLLIEAENDRPGLFQIQQRFAEVDSLRGDVPAAITRLQKAVRLSPSNPVLVRQLVSLLYASNRVEEAQKTLEDLGPDGIDGLERISAEMELRSGRFDDAVALAQRSVSAASQDPGDLLWLGQLLDRSGKQEEAGDLMERAVKAAPERSDAWLALFAHHFSAGRNSIADSVLARAERSLAEPDRQLVVAQGSELLGKLEAAERSLREAKAFAPENLEIARSLAAFLLRRGRLGPAREELERIVDTARRNDDEYPAASIWARRTLADLIAQGGDYKSLERALAIVGGNADGEGTLAAEDVEVQISLLSNRPEPASWRRAIDLLKTLAKSQPLSTTQRLLKAQLLERIGRWEECRDELVTVVALPNTPPTLYGILIEKLIEHGDCAGASLWLDRLKSIAPGAPLTLSLVSRLAMAENDRAAAVDAARKLMPPGPLPPDQLGQCAMTAKLMEDLGFPKAADKLLADFAAISPQGMLQRAEFLGRQKRPDEAYEMLQRAWDRVPLELLLRAALSVFRSQPDRLGGDGQARLERWFAKARRQDPESVPLGLLYAEFLDLQGRQAEVEAFYRQMLAREEIEPVQAAIVANNLAFHLARPATADEAQALVESALAELGPHPDVLDTRGLILMVQGDNRRAIQDFEEAVLQPSAVKFLHLAWAQMESKDVSAARRAFERAKKLGLKQDQLSPEDRERCTRLEEGLSAPLGA